jgi:hypothetical protein
MRPADFPLGPPESRAAARMQAQREQNSLKRIEIISNVPQNVSQLRSHSRTTTRPRPSAFVGCLNVIEKFLPTTFDK